MQYNKFNGLFISKLGMGCMRLPVTESGKIDYEKAEAIIDYCMVNGVNYYDTAYPYHGGESENFIGKALSKYERSSYYLATKFPIWEVKEEKDAERIFNEQLKKCNTDYFDFYLCHAMGFKRYDEYIKYNVFDFLLKKKAEGKIKYLGFSFHDTPEALKKILGHHKWDFTQIQFNYLDYNLQNAKEQLEILEDDGVPSIVMEPVRGGLLANVPSEAESIFKGLSDVTNASWALRYAMNFKNNFVVLSGMSNMEQVMDNVKTASHFEYLNEEELKAINDVKEILLGKNYIPCTSCMYCSVCPNKIPMHIIFQMFNEYQVKHNLEEFKEMYKNIPDEVKLDKCLNCKKCMTQCPQKINIPEKLREIGEMLK